jgi:hypothetical protein
LIVHWGPRVSGLFDLSLVPQNAILIRPKRREPMALKAISIEKFLNLKSQVEAVLASKVTEERHALESKLSKLAGFQTGKSASKGPGRTRRSQGRSGSQAL